MNGVIMSDFNVRITNQKVDISTYAEEKPKTELGVLSKDVETLNTIKTIFNEKMSVNEGTKEALLKKATTIHASFDRKANEARENSIITWLVDKIFGTVTKQQAEVKKMYQDIQVMAGAMRATEAKQEGTRQTEASLAKAQRFGYEGPANAKMQTYLGGVDILIRKGVLQPDYKHSTASHSKEFQGELDKALRTYVGDGNNAAVQVLLSLKANPNTPAGKDAEPSVLALAQQSGKKNLEKMLVDAGAKLTDQETQAVKD
jgi:hypothetical protein